MINYGLDKDCAFRKRLDLGTLMDFHAQNVAIRLEFFGINGSLNWHTATRANEIN